MSLSAGLSKFTILQYMWLKNISYYVKNKDSKAAHLSQVEFEYVADVVGIKVGELHQVLAILKRLAKLLYPRLGTIHAVDTLHSTKTKYIQHRKIRCNFQDHHGKTGFHPPSKNINRIHQSNINIKQYMHLQQMCANFRLKNALLGKESHRITWIEEELYLQQNIFFSVLTRKLVSIHLVQTIWCQDCVCKGN